MVGLRCTGPPDENQVYTLTNIPREPDRHSLKNIVETLCHAHSPTLLGVSMYPYPTTQSRTSSCNTPGGTFWPMKPLEIYSCALILNAAKYCLSACTSCLAYAQKEKSQKGGKVELLGNL